MLKGEIESPFFRRRGSTTRYKKGTKTLCSWHSPDRHIPLSFAFVEPLHIYIGKSVETVDSKNGTTVV